MAITTDVVVLGGGPGGYVAAIRLAQLKKSVTVIEEDHLGGVCLNWGCIPSKTLLHIAKKVEDLEKLSGFGVEATLHDIDMIKLHAHKDGIIGTLTQGIQSLFNQHHITVITGKGRFLSANTLEVHERGGEVRTIEFKNAIIACGSRPARLNAPDIPEFDGETILTSTDALNLKAIPPTLAIIGGGVIGLEIATIYQKLGSEIIIFEFMPQLMPGSDREAVKIIEAKLKRNGANIFVNTEIRKLSKHTGGCQIEASERGGQGLIEATAEKVLIAIGRTPNSDTLNLEAAGVTTTTKGFITVNDRLQTSNPTIFAIGDITGPPLLAHKASKEGIIAAEVIGGLPSGRDFQVIPAAAFTDPEYATVGPTEDELRRDQIAFEVARFPYAALGRSLTTGTPEGLIKVFFAPDTHQILSVCICGASASDLISEGALAIEMGATLDDLALTVHPHPTFSELFQEVAEVGLGHAIHIFKPPRKPL